MKAFRLAGLLRLRTAQERQAAGVLADRAAIRVEAAARSQHARERLGHHRTPDSTTAAGFDASVAARVALIASTQDALALLAAADTRLSDADRAWRSSRLDVRTLERLAEQHASRERAADLRREQLAVDEIVTGRDAGPGPDDGGAA